MPHMTDAQHCRAFFWFVDCSRWTLLVTCKVPFSASRSSKRKSSSRSEFIGVTLRRDSKWTTTNCNGPAPTFTQITVRLLQTNYIFPWDVRNITSVCAIKEILSADFECNSLITGLLAAWREINEALCWTQPQHALIYGSVSYSTGRFFLTCLQLNFLVHQVSR